MLNALPTTCPACHAPRLPDEQICAACGLIFSSFQEKDASIPAQTVATIHGPPLPAPIPAGAVLGQGRYRVVSLLEHADAARYHALDLALFERSVELLALPLRDEAARERALRLAQSFARLRHPALPQTFACFEQGGFLLIAREPAPGQPLPAQTPHAPAAVLGWGAQLADALAAIHLLPPPLRLRPSLAPAAIAYDRATDRLQLTQLALADEPHAPASDIAALAATLYELATGARDDGYAQLDALGPLGAAIAQALGMRGPLPSATTLALGLAALGRRRGREPLDAPDGARLADVPQLAQWCEAHWALAAPWLGDALHELVALRWGEEDLAAALRSLQACHHNPDERLDAALALLDPHGFGAALPVVDAPTQLRFGTLQGKSTRTRLLLLANTGRRYVRCSLRSFPGAAQLPGEIALRPGEAREVPVGVTMGAHALLRAPLGIEHNGQTLANVEVRARKGYWSRSPKSMGCITLIFALALICNLGNFASLSRHLFNQAQYTIALASGDTQQVEIASGALSNENPNDQSIVARRNEYYYQRATAALAQGDEAAAERTFLDLYERAPDYKDVALQLLTLYDGQASRFASQGRWDDTGRALVRLSAVAPGYQARLLKDRPELASVLERAWAAAWESGQMLRQPPEGGQGQRDARFSHNGLLEAVADSNGVHMQSRNDAQVRIGLHGSGAWQLAGDSAFSPDDTLLAVPARDGIRLARVADGAQIVTLADAALSANAVNYETFIRLVWSDDGQFLAAHNNQRITVWRSKDWHRVVSQSLSIYMAGSDDLAFSPDRSALAAKHGNDISVWRLADGQLLHTDTAVSYPFTAIAWTPDSQSIAVGSSDALRIWRIADRTQIVTLPIPNADSIAFNASGTLLATVAKGQVGLWRISDAHQVWSSPNSAWGRVQFSANGRSLAVINDQITRWRPMP